MSLLLIISIISMVIFDLGETYFVGPDKVQGDKAEDYCLSKGTHLASIHSEEDALAVGQLCNSVGDSRCYIGLRHDFRENLPNWWWYDGTPTDYGFIDGVNCNVSSPAFVPSELGCPEGIDIPDQKDWSVIYYMYLSSGIWGMRYAYFLFPEYPLCNDVPVCNYEYINDDISRTYGEATTLCDGSHGGLATITSDEEFECIKNLINGGPAAWTGLQSLDGKGGSFSFLDDTQCPSSSDYTGFIYDGCVPNEWWQYVDEKGRQRPKCPHNEENGAFCTNMNGQHINNDIKCDKTLQGVLCNKKPE